DLKPILKLVSRIVAIRNVAKGSNIGYGRSFTAKRDSVIGIIPIGYADGYQRGLSNLGVVTLEGQRGSQRRNAPLVGRVSMDLISVDVTDIADVHPGDPVT